MVVALVSLRADIASLEASLATAGWRTQTRDIHEETFPRDVGVEIDAAPRGRVVILLSVDSLDCALVFERIIPQYSERGIRVIVVTPCATQTASRRLLARAMAAGADDFVVATSVPDELVLRLDAVTWRRRPPREQRGRPVFNIAVDRASRRLRHAGVQVALTPGEFKVFSCLARYAGQPVSRANIQQCLARSKSPTKNLVDVYILYLRRKLAELNCPCVIQTVRGVGYALVTAPAPATVRARQERSEADPANSLAS